MIGKNKTPPISERRFTYKLPLGKNYAALLALVSSFLPLDRRGLLFARNRVQWLRGILGRNDFIDSMCLRTRYERITALLLST